jgi:hypothetical protein
MSTSGTTAAGFTGPYVSVVDSVDLSVSPANGTKPSAYGKRMSRRDSIASFPDVSVEQGLTHFNARVLSSNGALLYSGKDSANISSATFSIDIKMAAQGPVLLVAPDTAKKIDTLVDQSGNGFLSKSVVIYNRGNSPLVWSVKDTLLLNSINVCPSGCVSFLPSRGTIQAGTSAVMQLLHKAGSFSTAITFVIASSVGDVSVVILPF